MELNLRAALATFLASISFSAMAIPTTFSGTGVGPGSVPVAASATFNIIGDVLTISLTNTSGSNNGQDVPGSTLTGLFFSLPGAPVLIPVSALLGAQSSIIGLCTVNLVVGPCSGTNVGGEFGYQRASFTGGANQGIASSGYLTTSLPGNVGNFNGTNIDDPVSLDGINFGIVSKASGYNPNGGLQSVPVVSDSVVFKLSGATGFSTASISNVSFQYGTALTELNVPGSGGGGGTGSSIPEPETLLILGVGLAAMSAVRRRRKAQ